MSRGTEPDGGAKAAWIERAGRPRPFGDTVVRIILPAPPSPRVRTRLLWVALACLAVVLTVLELRTSWLQSWVFSKLSRQLTFSLEPGPAPDFRHPHSGPYDVRFGYSRLDDVASRLRDAGWKVEAQARPSPWLRRAMDWGIFPIYREKNTAGLTILDRGDRVAYSRRFPGRVYPDFESIPPAIVDTLLFVENREALDAHRRYQNPAVEWDRLANAFLGLGLSKLFLGSPSGGGSTLATQLEKLRHSPGGMTGSVGEKARQMVSASLRAYQDGRETWPARQRIVRDYLNSLPLAAVPGYGEVHGLGDGLSAWFGADFGEVNGLLNGIGSGAESGASAAAMASAYRQVLTLLLAVQRPTGFLVENRASLDTRVDQYLRLLGEEGVIPAGIRDLALNARLSYRDAVPPMPEARFADRKGVNSVRVELLGLLGADSLYALDRLDLTARATLDRDVQRQVAETLQRYRDPAHAAEAGLLAHPLLHRGDPASVVYSVTLYERTPEGNRLRIQADNYNQPLDINEGTKLELGSTAKLRTVVSYLEAVTDLHGQLAAMSADELLSLEIPREDRLSLWARDYLLAAEDRELPAMLEAAMNRRYSASPAEPFFTGGGLHRFVNFTADDNGRVMTVREAFERSVNLVFIRLMRDLVHYHLFRLPDVSPSILDDAANPDRHRYLVRFADYEGRQYLTGFLRKYEGMKPDEALRKLASGMGRKTPKRLALVHRYVRPDAGVDGFAAFLIGNLLDPNLSDQLIDSLYDEYGPDRLSLNDRAYLAGVHPLELWLLEYKTRHPGAGWGEIIEQSAAARQEAYQWLFRVKSKAAQDRAIRVMLEFDAFERIHQSWKRQGYPFSHLAPTYATAIGSSGDTPAALAELVGIILNGGMRYPNRRIEALRFAEDTPFETHWGPGPADGKRAIPAEVADLLKRELIGVVERGTGRRAAGSIVLPDGEKVPVGGKTGTGDNRFETYTSSGQVIDSRAINRTATFVFFIGDRFFGAVTAFVDGAAAADYGFTSSLPVQVFKNLAPAFQELLARGEGYGGRGQNKADGAP